MSIHTVYSDVKPGCRGERQTHCTPANVAFHSQTHCRVSGRTAHAQFDHDTNTRYVNVASSTPSGNKSVSQLVTWARVFLMTEDPYDRPIPVNMTNSYNTYSKKHRVETKNIQIFNSWSQQQQLIIISHLRISKIDLKRQLHNFPAS